MTDLPEGLHPDPTPIGTYICDAQGHPWVTLHRGAPGDPVEWEQNIHRLVIDTLAPPPVAASPTMLKLNRWRHRIPFWWWLTYDALVLAVIAAGISPFDPAFWLGLAVLAVAVFIDIIEFLVKRPSTGLD